jgi:hypothetical protein
VKSGAFVVALFKRNTNRRDTEHTKNAQRKNADSG